VRHRHNWGVYRVYFFDDDGQLASLEASWTDVDPLDPFVDVARGKAVARLVDLLDLVKIIDELEARKC
jgi:hypothetical protein